MTELKFLLGENIELSNGIIVKFPTLREIANVGENNYFGMVNTITSTPADLNWQLWEQGIDYTQISEFALFSTLILTTLKKYPIDMIFVNEDFQNYIPIYDENIKDISLLKNINTGRIITISDYNELTDLLRKIHNFKKNEKKPANESTKQVLIELAKSDYMANLQKKQKSILANLISAMVNSEGFKYNYETVWDLKLNNFMNSVQRINKIKQSELLLQSGYSGFGISLKDINKDELNWLGDIN